MHWVQNQYQPQYTADKLPLSWIRSSITSPILPAVSLPLSRYYWIQNATIPWEMSMELLYSSQLTRFHEGFVIRGCPPAVHQLLSRKGCECMLTGSEARLSLENRNNFKKSVRELRKRGLRWGKVIEITHHPNAASIFLQLQRKSIHGSEPQLKHLFRINWEKTGRYFIFHSFTGDTLAGISLSREALDSWHTEVILRKPGTPVGVMEALILEVFHLLQKEGYSFFSLGEVPFYSQQEPDQRTAKLFFKSGYLLRFAYPYHGLFHFKNKFSPEWHPLYLCSSKPISWTVLLDLYIRSGFLRLTLNKLLRWMPI